MDSPRAVHVTGNLCTGKTVLADALSKALGAEKVFEPDLAAADPYWTDFASNPRDWAFHQQIAFLRLAMESARGHSDHSIVQDYSLIGSLVFAEAMHHRGWMTDRDYGVYNALARACLGLLPLPTIILWLWVPSMDTLSARIAHRRRVGENKLDATYLRILQDAWAPERAYMAAEILKCPVLTIDTRLHDVRMSTTVAAICDALRTSSDGGVSVFT